MQAAPIALWVGALLVLALAAFPLARRLVPAFPDRGAALAPVLALTILTLVAYWIGHVRYGTLTAVAALGILLAVAAWVVWQDGYPDLRPAAAPVAVFLVAFAFMLAIRVVDPAAHAAGGEKFLDFGLVKSLLRADRLPPEDLWFAGERLRYYYAGPLLVATISELTGVAVKYAYNLGLATGYATLVTGAYGLAAALADARGRTPWKAGAFGAFFVGFAGNLATPARLILGRLPQDLVLTYGEFVLAGIRKTPPDAFEAIVGTSWSFWLGRYVIPGTLNVFPLWSYLNGDLHAHVLAPAFLVLAVAVCFAAYRATGYRRLVLLFGVLPAVAGLLALMSTWSYPTAVGLAFLTLALTDYHPAGDLPVPERFHTPLVATPVRRELSRHLLAGLGALGVAAIGYAWASPYFLFHTPVNRGVGFLPPRSPLGPLALVHGIFLLAFAAFLWRHRPSLSIRSWQAGLIGALAGLTLSGLVVADLAALALVGPFLAIAWWACRRSDAGYEALLVIAGAGLVLAVEFAYAKVWPHDPNAPRWNTVYKVYMQVWVLWGIGAGAALGSLVDRARPLGRLRPLLSLHPPERARDVLPVLALIALLVPAATFGVAALAEHAAIAPRTDDPSLDATEFIETYHPHEAEAINWLDRRSGTPTITTYPGEPVYTWKSAPSVFTGLPTVVGWRHEAGYRGMDAYQTRVRDVEFMYEAEWASAAIMLDKHDVEYVYVGPVEREHYEIRQFAGRTGVEVAFENEGVVIYEVDADQACESTDVQCPSE